MNAFLIDPYHHKIVRLSYTIKFDADPKMKHFETIKWPNLAKKFEFENGDVLAVDEMLNQVIPDLSTTFSEVSVSGRAVLMGKDSQTGDFRDPATSIEELISITDFRYPKPKWPYFSYFRKVAIFYIKGVCSRAWQEIEPISGPTITINKVEEFFIAKAQS